MISVEHDIMPLIEEQAGKLVAENPAVEPEIKRLMDNFRTTYGTRSFEDVKEFTGMCAELDRDPHVEPTQGYASLMPELRRVRGEILQSVVHEEGKKQRRARREADEDEHGFPGARNSRRIQIIHPKEMPTELKKYLDLAMIMGPDALVQALVSAGYIEPEKQPLALTYISRYLGKGAHTPAKKSGGILAYHPVILELNAVQDVLASLLRTELYRFFAERADELLASDTSEIEREVTAYIEDALKAQGITEPLSPHRKLIKRLVKEFQEMCAWQRPASMVSHVDYKGESYIFPSLRQRFAIHRIEQEQHAYVAFPPGGGKTAVPLLVWEKERERAREEGEKYGRMLFICPPSVIDELPGRITSDKSARVTHEGYYNEGNRPSVGIIRRDMKEEEVLEELKADIVFASYSMMHVTKGDEQVVHHIVKSGKKNPFSIMAMDEAHLLNGDKQYAGFARTLITELPGLKEKGHIVALSGTPAPNNLIDMQVVLEMLEDRKPTNNPIQKKNSRMAKDGTYVDPDFMRNASMRRLVLPDERDDWEQHIVEVRYGSSEREKQFIRIILEDETMTNQMKMLILNLFQLNPPLASGNKNMPSSLMEKLKEQLDSNLAEGRAGIIAESNLSGGVTRAHEDVGEEGYLMPMKEEIAAYLKKWSKEHGIDVIFHVIDGHTKPEDRERMYRDAREAQETGLKKCVILVQRQCINYGANLSFMDWMTVLEHPFNAPDLEQLIKRCLREGNTKLRVQLLFGEDSLHEAFYDHAKYKHALIDAFLYGRNASERLIRAASRKLNVVDGVPLSDKDIQAMTEMARYLDRYDRGGSRVQAVLHGRGLGRYDRYWKKHATDYEYLALVKHGEMQMPPHTSMIAGLLTKLRQEDRMTGSRVLDLNSFGFALQRVMNKGNTDDTWDFTNMDPVQEVYSAAKKTMLDDGRGGESVTWHQGTIADAFRHCREQKNSFDVIVATDGFQFTHGPIQQSNGEAGNDEKVRRGERVRLLFHYHDLLQKGGTLCLAIPEDACTEQEWTKFLDQVGWFGFSVDYDYSGLLESVDNETGDRIARYVLVARKEGDSALSHHERVQIKEALDPSAFVFTHIDQWSDKKRREFKRSRPKKLLPQSFAHQDFRIGAKKFHFDAHAALRKRQLFQYDEVCTAVRILREMHAEGLDITKLPKSKYETLHELGVLFNPILSKKMGRPVFVYVFDKHGIAQLLYPLDERWNDALKKKK